MYHADSCLRMYFLINGVAETINEGSDSPLISFNTPTKFSPRGWSKSKGIFKVLDGKVPT